MPCFSVQVFHWHVMSPDYYFVSVVVCGKTPGADLLGVESEPWAFKGGVSGEVQVGCACIIFHFPYVF